MGSRRAFRPAISPRLVSLRRGEQGTSLIEILVVMAILSIVLAGLTNVFVSGMHAELDLNQRYQAQQHARLALDNIRGDIHCASAAQAQTISTYPGVKLAVGNCYPATATISWCAVLVTSAPPRYQVWRSTATSSICTASDATRRLVADYLTTSSNVFTTSTIPYQGLETVSIDFPVNVNTSVGSDKYELKDSIVARNSTRCATVAGCSVPSVP